MTPAEKQAFLLQKRTIKAIHRVASSRSVPEQDYEDIVQQTYAFAWKARLPKDEVPARKILNRIAFVCACRHMGQDPGKVEEYTEVHSDDEETRAVAATPPYDPVLHDDVERLLAEGRKEYPNRADAFVESALKGTPANVEAARRGVSEGHVRKERSEIRTYLKKHAGKMGLIGVGILLLVIGDMTGWDRVPFMPRKSHTSDLATIRHELRPVANDPAALRERAARLCASADWDACLIDLDAAQALDHRDETDAEQQMRQEAMRSLYVQEGAPVPFNNSKLPLH
jgi:DNA-directed RNA polymerase specialized sigma24 family protein